MGSAEGVSGVVAMGPSSWATISHQTNILQYSFAFFEGGIIFMFVVKSTGFCNGGDDHVGIEFCGGHERIFDEWR